MSGNVIGGDDSNLQKTEKTETAGPGNVVGGRGGAEGDSRWLTPSDDTQQQ